jgi:methylglutaconyl-CoA hydratase
MTLHYIDWEVIDNIGIITINRPDKRNALNAQMVTELKYTFGNASTDNDCRVVVLRSSSDVFCAGADLQYLKGLQSNSREENVKDSTHLMELFKTIYTFPKVVISMVDGPAIAGGCGLATITDFCFASPKASFGYTEVRIGFIPAIVLVFLVRKIGEGKAREILLSGEVFNTERAHSLGLVNTIVLEDDLEQFTTDFAKKIIKTTSGQSVTAIKQMLAEVPEKSLSDALIYAAEMNAAMRETEDCKRGINAFLNKEKITWT